MKKSVRACALAKDEARPKPSWVERRVRASSQGVRPLRFLLINALYIAGRISVRPDDLLVLVIVDGIFAERVVVAISGFDD